MGWRKSMLESLTYLRRKFRHQWCDKDLFIPGKWKDPFADFLCKSALSPFTGEWIQVWLRDQWLKLTRVNQSLHLNLMVFSCFQCWWITWFVKTTSLTFLPNAWELKVIYPNIEGEKTPPHHHHTYTHLSLLSHTHTKRKPRHPFVWIPLWDYWCCCSAESHMKEIGGDCRSCDSHRQEPPPPDSPHPSSASAWTTLHFRGKKNPFWIDFFFFPEPKSQFTRYRSWNTRMYPVWKDGDPRFRNCWTGEVFSTF